jgi:translocation protein SEC63
MILAGSYEFWKKFNTEIIERESDDKEIPQVMRELRNLGEKKKEPPLCLPWSLKARTLIHAYLTRVDLLSEKLGTDQNYIIGRSVQLTEEFLRILIQMMAWPIQRTPKIDTLENALRVFPMLVQALWPRNSNLLQLPHLTEPNVAYLRKVCLLLCRIIRSYRYNERNNI